MNHPYVPHDWSPGLWTLMLAGMILYTLAVLVGCTLMAYRASQATAAPSPKLPPSDQVFPRQAKRSDVRTPVDAAR